MLNPEIFALVVAKLDVSKRWIESQEERISYMSCYDYRTILRHAESLATYFHANPNPTFEQLVIHFQKEMGTETLMIIGKYLSNEMLKYQNGTLELSYEHFEEKEEGKLPEEIQFFDFLSENKKRNDEGLKTFEERLKAKNISEELFNYVMMYKEEKIMTESLVVFDDEDEIIEKVKELKIKIEQTYLYRSEVEKLIEKMKIHPEIEYEMDTLIEARDDFIRHLFMKNVREDEDGDENGYLADELRKAIASATEELNTC